MKNFPFSPLKCRDLGQNWVEFGVFFQKRTELFPLKDYKGHLVKKSSFKGLFEIKDSRTYTGSVSVYEPRTVITNRINLDFGKGGFEYESGW